MKTIRSYCGKVSSRGPSLYVCCPILDGFAQSRNAPNSFVMSVCPSVCLSVCVFVCLHVLARLLVDGFS
jgi:hypothetical protein